MERQLTAALAARDDEATRAERFGIISKMLLAKPIAGASAAVGKARGEAYLEAMSDIPPWAIAAVMPRWHRGECGDGHNYTWAPDTHVWRKLALAELTPLRAALTHVTGLLAATTLDVAMHSAEQDAADKDYVNTGFARLKAELGGRPDVQTSSAQGERVAG